LAGHLLNSEVCSDFDWGFQPIRLVSYHFKIAMNFENNSNKQWPDPKDYGLPVVDIKPIIPVLSSSLPKVQQEASSENQSATEEIDSNPVVSSISADKSAELQVSKTPAVQIPKPEISKSIPSEKKSKSWIRTTAVLSVVILAVIIWQMTAENKEIENSVAFESGDVQVLTTSEEPVSSVNDSKVEEIQATENQFTESELPSSSNTTIQKSETGTTIDRNATGTLIRVESKAASPTYFIIVGSLPNERFALTEAPQYQNRVPAVYLITPYDDTKNYRLAIGSFGSFTKANEELERIKADYTEALWILKY
jgi:hypothetical protein